MKCVEGGVEEEAHQVLKNMGAILKNSGCDFSNGKFSSGDFSLGNNSQMVS